MGPMKHALHGGVHAGAAWQIKGKGSPYSITVRRVPELIPVLGSQPAGMQLPAQPLRGLLPISQLREERHNGCEQFA